jgi:serine/threonine protein phosphatase PrpC
MQIESFGLTDTGLVRSHNEDFFLADSDSGLFLVADGMGGLAKGEVASRMAVDAIEQFIFDSVNEDITWPISPRIEYSESENRFLAAIALANWQIYNTVQQDSAIRGMGATLAGVLIHREEMVITNVGDARVYLIRDGVITQMTEDHSLVMDEVRRGNITLEEARTHPQRNIITRALGIGKSVQADIFNARWRRDDLLLLCSDGLTGMLTDEEILASLNGLGDGAPDLADQARSLVSAANERGGRDNITVVLVRIAAA